VAGRHHVVVADGLLELEPLRQRDVEIGGASGAPQDGARLQPEDARHVARIVDVVVVASRGVGHPLHEELVVLHPEADGRDRDAVLGRPARDARQLAGARDPDVRLAVGEQDHLVHLPGLVCAEHLGQPGEEATREVGAASVAERADGADGGRARGGVDDHRRHRQVHAVGERHQRQPVAVPELAGEPLGRLQHVAERVPMHRPRSIEDQRDVERRQRRGRRPPADAHGGVDRAVLDPRPDAAADVDGRGLGAVRLRGGPLGRRRQREHLVLRQPLEPRRHRELDEHPAAAGGPGSRCDREGQEQGCAQGHA